jgi:hypothetical protein
VIFVIACLLLIFRDDYSLVQERLKLRHDLRAFRRSKLQDRWRPSN